MRRRKPLPAWMDEPRRTLDDCQLDLEIAKDRINAFYARKAPEGGAVCIDTEMEAYVGLEIALIQEFVCASMPEFIVTESRLADQQDTIDQIVCPQERLIYDEFFPRKPAIRRVPEAMRLSPEKLASELAPEDPDMKTSFQIVQLADFLTTNRMTMSVDLLAQLLRHNGIDIEFAVDEAPTATLVRRAYEWIKGVGLPLQAKNIQKAFVTEGGRALPLGTNGRA